MTDFLRYLLIGLGNGAIYAMLGLGLVVIYRSTGLLNFAQGEMAMFSTFLCWQFHDLGLSIWFALFASMIVSFVLGSLVHRVIVSPLGDPHDKPLAVVIVTIGLFLGINALAQLIWGSQFRSLPKLFGEGQLQIGDVAVQWQKVGAVGVLGVEALVFWLIFQRTRIGLWMRAVASNSESAALCGIPVARVLMLGWGLAAAIGAVAGVFTAPNIGSLDPNLMQLTLIFGFATITLGGFDSLVGAVVGGLLVGITTEVIPKYVPFLEKITLAPAFILILIVLLVRPSGLFGSKQVTRV